MTQNLPFNHIVRSLQGKYGAAIWNVIAQSVEQIVELST